MGAAADPVAGCWQLEGRGELEQSRVPEPAGDVRFLRQPVIPGTHAFGYPVGKSPPVLGVCESLKGTPIREVAAAEVAHLEGKPLSEMCRRWARRDRPTAASSAHKSLRLDTLASTRPEGELIQIGGSLLFLPPAMLPNVFMPTQLLIRCASLVVTAALCGAWRNSAATFVWTTYSLGLAHYFIALRYSTRQIGQVLAAPAQLLSLAGLGLLTLALYYDNVSLMAYFGLHHVLNEAYSRRCGEETSTPAYSQLNAAAVAFHGVSYVTILRFDLGFSWVDIRWFLLALVVAIGPFVQALLKRRPFRSGRHMLDLCSAEIAVGVLIVASLFVRVTFLQVVLYHFVLWALLPIERIRSRGKIALGRYLAGSVALAGIFALISPLGPLPTQIGAATFSRQFLFWSYAHISLSLALSDAHPRWMTRLFRGAAETPVSAPAQVPG